MFIHVDSPTLLLWKSFNWKQFFLHYHGLETPHAQYDVLTCHFLKLINLR